MRQIGFYTLAFLFALGACAPVGPTGGGGKNGGGKGKDAEKKDVDVDVVDASTPQAAGTVTVVTDNTASFELSQTTELPGVFTPTCMAPGSRVVPAVLVDEFLGIRSASPAGVFGPEAQQDSDLVEGWAVSVYNNVPGTDFPDYSMLTPIQTEVQNRPDFDEAPGDLNASFAVRSETQFNMPLTRTVEFRLRARTTARITIDGQELLTTAIVAGGVNPQAESVEIELAAGEHRAVVEYKHDNGAPVFAADMRFVGEDTFRSLTHSGATPFSVKVADSGDGEDDDTDADPAIRSVHWPAIAGSENVKTCINNLNDATNPETSAWVDLNRLVRVTEQTATSLPAPMRVADIAELWIAPRGSGLSVESIALGENQVGIGLPGEKVLKLTFDDLLGDGLGSVDQAHLLGVTAQKSGAIVNALFGVQTDDGWYLSTLTVDGFSGTLQAILRPTPSEWGDELAPVGLVDKMVLVHHEDGLAAIDGLGTAWLPIETPDFDFAKTINGRVLLGGQDSMWILESSDLIDLYESVLNELEPDNSDVELSATEYEFDRLDTSNSNNFWIDDFDQIWELDGQDIKVHTEDGHGVIMFYPGDGRLYLDDPSDVEEVEMSNDSDTLLTDDSPEKTIGLRDKVGGVTGWLALKIKMASGKVLQAKLASSLVSGKEVEYDDDEDGDDDDGVIVDPGDDPDPDLPDVSYEDDIAPLMARSCLGLGCHSGARPASGLPLTSKQEVQDRFTSVYGSAGPAGNMPIGRPKLSAAELQLLDDWRLGLFQD